MTSDDKQNKIIEGVKVSTELGFKIFPVGQGGKKPAIKGWQKRATNNWEYAGRYFSGHNSNYGIVTGAPSRVFVLDIDGPEGAVSLALLETVFGKLPVTLKVSTPHGSHYFFRTRLHEIPNSVGKIADHIDVRGDGGYVVGPGSSTAEGDYAFAPGCGPEVPIAAAPHWLIARAEKKENERSGEPAPPGSIPLHLRSRARRWAKVGLARELDRLKKAPLHQRNNTLNQCVFRAGQLVARGLVNAGTATLEIATIARSIGLGETEIERTIESGFRAGRDSPARIPFVDGFGSATPSRLSTVSDADLAKELARLGETDTDNAERLVKRFGSELIFSPTRGWMAYDGTRFKPDAHFACVEFAKEVARKIADEAGHLSDARAIAARLAFSRYSMSKAGIDRMVDLAKSRLVVDDETLDADPWLLNTETCTIDLRTGTYFKQDPRDLITKVAKVKAKPFSRCPIFRSFLQRITGGDQALCDFIQKAVGYSLTGITSEQVLFLIYGKGDNGKSTFINTIRDMLGDYGRHTPTETLLTKQYDNAISADLARLRGARMVTAVEANFNRSLDEAKIKALTGGEPTTARELYQNFQEFLPLFKLWLVGNDRPRVRATDYAIWRRLRVIPFSVRIQKNEVDRKLPEKLRAELPGILCWAIAGCLRWQREGLIEPAAVLEAASQWRRDADHVKRFFSEKIALTPNSQTSAATMHNEFLGWCKQNGEAPMSAAELKTQLCEKCDLTHKRTKAGSIWVGVTIRA